MGGSPRLPPIDWIENAPQELGNWTYLFAGAMALLELGTLLGVPAPFEVGVILSGAVAGEGEIAFVPLVLIVWACGTIGESLNFWTGRRFGRSFLLEHGARLRVTPELIARVDRHFERRGALTVLIGRFIPLVRSSAPFVAGSSLLAYQRFLPLSVAGNLAWATVFCGLGYVFFRSAERVADLVGWIGLGLFCLIALIAGAIWLQTRRGRH